MSMTIDFISSNNRSTQNLTQKISKFESESRKKVENSNKNLKASIDAAHFRITKISGYLKSTNSKIDQVRKALEKSDKSLQSFKTVMIPSFQKITEKLDEISVKSERKAVEKIEEISKSLKDSQNLALEKIKVLGSDLSVLSSTF